MPNKIPSIHLTYPSGATKDLYFCNNDCKKSYAEQTLDVNNYSAINFLEVEIYPKNCLCAHCDKEIALADIWLDVDTVRQLIGVEDGERIAYGYTFNRDTVEIYIRDGKLIREDYRGSNSLPALIRENEFFDPSYFSDDIKRFYEERTNKKLQQLFRTFGGELSTTPG
jgi:hypothetical protein